MSRYVPSGYSLKILISAAVAISLCAAQASAATAPTSGTAPSVVKTQGAQPSDVYFQSPKGSNNRL